MNKYLLLKMNSRGGRYYAEEIETGLRKSLKTAVCDEAEKLLHALNVGRLRTRHPAGPGGPRLAAGAGRDRPGVWRRRKCGGPCPGPRSRAGAAMRAWPASGPRTRTRCQAAAHIPTKPIAQVRAQPGQECAGAPSPILRFVAQSLQERHRIGDLCLRVEQTRASLLSLVGMDVEAVRASLRPDFTPICECPT
jgi:hypothetical protein